jgi:Leucine-rich repeat (LRR) protein
LNRLTHLDLSGNQLTGDIPLALDNLNELRYLFLSENDFSSGEIPTFVYTFDKLRELSLKSTQRTGPISKLVGLLEKLILLDLDNNSLTGPIPTEIGELRELQFLLLNRNELTEDVPVQLGSLDKLRKFSSVECERNKTFGIFSQILLL